MLTWVLRGQGAYYLVTGLWPLISMSAFERVTGPKVDDWLVRMVALLIIVIAVTLLLTAFRAHPAAECVFLAVASALSFAAIDLVYALSGRISPIYLLDAAAELGLVVLITIGWRRARRPGG